LGVVSCGGWLAVVRKRYIRNIVSIYISELLPPRYRYIYTHKRSHSPELCVMTPLCLPPPSSHPSSPTSLVSA
jgi:hypothetical protein